MSYSFLMKRSFNWKVAKLWHNFLEGVQCAAGAEEVHVEAAKPDWSNGLGQGETGLDVAAAISWSMKNQTPNISLLAAVRNQPWTMFLTHITVVLLCLSFLCLVRNVGNCLLMCENGQRMQSYCCDRIFGKWDPWLLQCWPCEILGQLQDCKCCVFNLHLFPTVCFENFLHSSALEPYLVSLRLKRFIKSLATTGENYFSGDPINREIT